MSLDSAGRARLGSPPRNLEFLLFERTRFLRTHLKPGDKVLEVGAGYGIAARYVPDLEVVTTDVRHAPWHTAVADVMRLPFRDDVFDAAVCLNVLHHVDYPVKAVAEMTRVVREGGRILIAEPHASLALRLALSVTGHEYVDATVEPFAAGSCQRPGPGNGNNAIGDRLFGNTEAFRRAFPGLVREHHRLCECLTFLNSGGVERRTPYIPLPAFALRWLSLVDDRLARFPTLFPMCQEVVFRKRAATPGL